MNTRPNGYLLIYSFIFKTNRSSGKKYKAMSPSLSRGTMDGSSRYPSTYTTLYSCLKAITIQACLPFTSTVLLFNIQRLAIKASNKMSLTTITTASLVCSMGNNNSQDNKPAPVDPRKLSCSHSGCFLFDFLLPLPSLACFDSSSTHHMTLPIIKASCKRVRKRGASDDTTLSLDAVASCPPPPKSQDITYCPHGPFPIVFHHPGLLLTCFVVANLGSVCFCYWSPGTAIR